MSPSARPASEKSQVRPSAPPDPAECRSAMSAMTATQNEGRCHQVLRLLSPSARPATRNEVGCHQVPCLPRKAKVDVSKRHACHAKWCERWCVTKLCVCVRVQSCDKVAPPEPAQCHKFHTCYAKRRWMSPSATPATRNDGGCHQVQRLPGKVM